MNPFEVLSLSPEATPAEVQARWRELASEHHPDKGGDGARFHEYRVAYEAALQLANEPKLCDNCGGVGKTLVMCGFNQITMTCGVCRGTGAK